MTTTYDIFSNLGFIGFCIIYNNGQVVQGNLLLFETVTLGNNTFMNQHSNNNKFFPLNTADLNVIQDLMLVAIPTLRTNGLSYRAVDSNGHSHVI